jgi:hypothetical protein
VSKLVFGVIKCPNYYRPVMAQKNKFMDPDDTMALFVHLFLVSDHYKLLQIAKRLAFQSAYMRITLVKTVQNQREHRIG